MATISKADIGTGNTIQSEHITRIIDALNGTGSADVIATGSFTGSFNGFADTWTVQDLTVFGTASINYFETIYETYISLVQPNLVTARMTHISLPVVCLLMEMPC